MRTTITFTVINGIPLAANIYFLADDPGRWINAIAIGFGIGVILAAWIAAFVADHA